MSDWMLACLSFFMTVAVYYLNKSVHRRFPKTLLAPIIATPAILIALVLFFHVPLEDYYRYTHYLVLMLGPATIAFALPIYQQREMIAKYPITISLGVITGVTLGLLTSWGFSQAMHIPAELEGSLLVRSVSTPFAMQAAEAFGGIPDLAAMLVMMTGIVGMMVCEPAFKLVGIRTSLAKGAGLGAASHGAGTAKAHAIGREEGVIASLTMVFSGIAMVLGAPIFSSFL